MPVALLTDISATIVELENDSGLSYPLFHTFLTTVGVTLAHGRRLFIPYCLLHDT